MINGIIGRVTALVPVNNLRISKHNLRLT